MRRTKQDKAHFGWVDTTNLVGCWGYTHKVETQYCDGYTRLNYLRLNKRFKNGGASFLTGAGSTSTICSTAVVALTDCVDTWSG